LSTIYRKASANPCASMATYSAATDQVCASNSTARDARSRPKQAMNASGRTGLDADAGKKLGVARRRFVLAQPRETGAGHAGFKRQALAECAGKLRLAAEVLSALETSTNFLPALETSARERNSRSRWAMPAPARNAAPAPSAALLSLAQLGNSWHWWLCGTGKCQWEQSRDRR
jgi:hypothetical protein